MTASAPIRIFCLGHFRLERGGEGADAPFALARKPLELLKTLIALGGENVPEQQLTDSVWPDLDGDAAHGAFASTLHRLRQVLGGEALTLRQRQLTLDANHVWCDCRELALAFGEAEAALDMGDSSAAGKALDEVLALYRGPFLEGEFDPPEILVARDRLHGRMLRALREAAGLLERNGERDAAIRLYQKGAEADPIAEELVQPLLRLLQREGRASEAEAVYQRLRRNLEAQGGIAPSAETEAVRRAPTRSTVHVEPAARSENTTAAVETIPLPEKPSLAVLPLTNMSGDPTLDYFSDGLAEDLITDLSQYAQLSVVARNSSFAYRGRAVDVREIGRDLGVGYVLEGSVRESEEKDRVRITFQLADAASGAHIWAERYDRELKDVFALQEEIVDKVTLAIDVRLAEGEHMIGRRRSTRSFEAYKAVRRAIECFELRTPEQNDQALRLVPQALAIDPNYSYAWGLLAHCHITPVNAGWSADPERDLAGAEDYAKKALALEPHQADSMLAMGNLHQLRGNFEEALHWARQAVEFNPRHAPATAFVGTVLIYSGDVPGGLSWMEKGLAMSPQPAAWMYAHAGTGYLLIGQPGKAMQFLRQSLMRAPGYLLPAVLMILVQHESGNTKDAAERFADVLRVSPRFSEEMLNGMLSRVRDSGFRARVRGALHAAGMK
jgi:TolB-like protein